MTDHEAALTDRIFFPLIACIAIALVLLAMQRSESPLPTGSVSGAKTNYLDVRIDGVQLNRFIPDQMDMSLIPIGDNYILDLSAASGDFPSAVNAGPHFRLAPDLEVAFSGQKLQITVRARASAETGAEAFEVNYLSGPEGSSGWQTFPLTPDFTDYHFQFRAPLASQERGVDFLGIRPLVEDGSKPVDMQVESVTFLNISTAPAIDTAGSSPQ